MFDSYIQWASTYAMLREKSSERLRVKAAEGFHERPCGVLQPPAVVRLATAGPPLLTKGLSIA